MQQALGLLSLLVGMFLIYNTMTFLVIQRWRLIGSLRLLGVSRKQVFTMIVQEALLLALAGTGTGILLGILLAQGLLQGCFNKKLRLARLTNEVIRSFQR